jgi:CheY-like chemotaxis protein
MDNLPLLLLVEDEHLIRTALASALEDGGYTLLQAENGLDAVAVLEGHTKLTGLITDIRLGSGASGWEVARRARQLHPELAVVYMTGDSAADWSADGVPNSILLQKPFADAQVITAISTLLNTA